MRRLLWMIFLFGVYVWLMTSGHDRMVIQQGKSLFESVVAWFDDAEIDFQTAPQKAKKEKKKSRRWD